jgi:ABC-type nitrate/sulfonate/bicarbonate transport system substrate-binding protein
MNGRNTLSVVIGAGLMITILLFAYKSPPSQKGILPTPTPEVQLPIVRLASYDLPAFALFPFGVENGFFKSEGVDLQITATNSMSFNGGLFEAGRFHMYTQGNSAFYKDQSHHNTQKWILTIVISNGDIAFIGNNKTIKTLDEVRGKKAAVVPNAEFFFYSALRKFKIDPKEVTIIPVPNFQSIPARVASGEFDVGHVFRGSIEDPHIASSTHILFTTSNDFGSTGGGGLIASSKLLDEDPELARAVVRGYFKSLDYAIAHPEEINKFYKIHYPHFAAKFGELTFHPNVSQNHTGLRDGAGTANMYAVTRYYTLLLGHTPLDPAQLFTDKYLP